MKEHLDGLSCSQCGHELLTLDVVRGLVVCEWCGARAAVLGESGEQGAEH
ncbi:MULTISPECIES: hypothetical protein [unclassified Nonomuraea]